MSFIEEIIDSNLKKNNSESKIITRFPPENNAPGLHIGHAKSICLNFGIADKYKGECNLRFDDTNPSAEKASFVDNMISELNWLGFKPNNIYFTSDYFEQIHTYAIKLIRLGKAYVCDLSSEEISEQKGTPTKSGLESPYRNRSIEENLLLFSEMKNNKYDEGTKSLRLKIDMTSDNMHMRDPIIYRIKKESHHRHGDKWCIYPMYDFAHCISDAIENITYSLCTLEFEVHRPLYEWILNSLNFDIQPKQLEFSRLNITNNMMSKRKILSLIEASMVSSWDDPRLYTIAGLIRRGYTSKSIRDFCEKVGISKKNALTSKNLLESCLRSDLNKVSNRVMCVVNPLKVTISNFEEGNVDWLEAINNPEDESEGTRMIPFTKHLYIEREDFREDANKKFYRLTNGKEVRFKHAYYVKCEEVIKGENGEIIELICTIDPKTKGGWSDDGRKVKGTIHWVSIDHSEEIKIREFDDLFNNEIVEDIFIDYNENSIKEYNAFIEPNVKSNGNLQFERIGYFINDKDSNCDMKIYNKTVSLRERKISKNIYNEY